jgi:hypothetical protein
MTEAPLQRPDVDLHQKGIRDVPRKESLERIKRELIRLGEKNPEAGCRAPDDFVPNESGRENPAKRSAGTGSRRKSFGSSTPP